MAALTLQVDDGEALRALIDRDLSKRRAFLPGASLPSGVAERSPCDLVVLRAGQTVTLAGEVVYVRDEGPGKGVGLALAPLDAQALALLRAMADAPDDPAVDPAVDASVEASAGPGPVRLHERLVALSGLDQQKLAGTGTLPERIALERMYGPNVWPALLENPRVTIPEVARVARKGTLPRPLVEAIAANTAWLAAGEVQRALLSNPRASAAVLEKVLRALPRRDLQLVPVQTAYPMAVRMAAKKMLGGG
jgi:hypothetical protein